MPGLRIKSRRLFETSDKVRGLRSGQPRTDCRGILQDDRRSTFLDDKALDLSGTGVIPICRIIVGKVSHAAVNADSQRIICLFKYGDGVDRHHREEDLLCLHRCH